MHIPLFHLHRHRPEILAALREGAPEARAFAARELGALGPATKETAFRPLVGLLRDPDAGLRAAAAAALSRLEPLAAADMPILVEVLHYRESEARLYALSALGPAGRDFTGHEFHYATITEEGSGAALFGCRDARGRDLGAVGRQRGRIGGSFIHLIDRAGL